MYFFVYIDFEYFRSLSETVSTLIVGETIVVTRSLPDKAESQNLKGWLMRSILCSIICYVDWDVLVGSSCWKLDANAKHRSSWTTVFCRIAPKAYFPFHFLSFAHLFTCAVCRSPRPPPLFSLLLSLSPSPSRPPYPLSASISFRSLLRGFRFILCSDLGTGWNTSTVQFTCLVANATLTLRQVGSIVSIWGLENLFTFCMWSIRIFALFFFFGGTPNFKILLALVCRQTL